MNTGLRTLVFWAIIFISAFLLWSVIRSARSEAPSSEISYSTFTSDVEAGKVARVSITGTRIDGQYRDGSRFHLTGPNDPRVYIGALRDKGVEIRFKDAQPASLPLQLLGTWAPLLLLGALWFAMIRRFQGRKPPNQPGGPPGGSADPPWKPIEPR
jgi:cell division protease FtsH